MGPPVSTVPVLTLCVWWERGWRQRKQVYKHPSHPTQEKVNLAANGVSSLTFRGRETAVPLAEYVEAGPGKTGNYCFYSLCV